MKELVVGRYIYQKPDGKPWRWRVNSLENGLWSDRLFVNEAAMLDEIVALRERVEELKRGDAAINAALNEGDGVYRS